MGTRIQEGGLEIRQGLEQTQSPRLSYKQRGACEAKERKYLPPTLISVPCQ